LQHEERSMIEKEAREQLGFVKPGEVVLFEQKAKVDARPSAVADNMDQRAP
jgi:cell division protein FtsB